jgi:hypothetical protein
MIWGEGLQMPTIMVTTISIMTIHQTTEAHSHLRIIKSSYTYMHLLTPWRRGLLEKLTSL